MRWIITTANLVAAALLSTSIFLFVQDKDDLAINFLFLVGYGWFTTLYFLRGFWYDRHTATWNELFFIFGAHIIPIICIAFTEAISFGDPLMSDAPVIILDQPMNISVLTILSLPFLIMATALQFRCFLSYEFVRYGSQSTSGLPAEITAFFLFLVSGYALIYVSWIMGDLIGYFWGFFFWFVGFGWLLTKA